VRASSDARSNTCSDARANPGTHTSAHAVPDSRSDQVPDEGANQRTHTTSDGRADAQPDANARHHQLVRGQGGWALSV